jgi:hypothetical protein
MADTDQRCPASRATGAVVPGAGVVDAVAVVDVVVDVVVVDVAATLVVPAVPSGRMVAGASGARGRWRPADTAVRVPGPDAERSRPNAANTAATMTTAQMAANAFMTRRRNGTEGQS